MKASLNVSVNLAGQSASINQSRTQSGAVGITLIATPAVAGVLTARSSVTAGTITVTAKPSDLVAEVDKAVLTWVDGSGNLKHQYNVVVGTVTNVGSESGESSSFSSVEEADEVDEYTVAISAGVGDDLPALDSAINISLQGSASMAFDFSEMDTFAVTTNVRGVLVFMSAVPGPLCVVDMAANSVALWIRASGFPAPITGSVANVLYGSGDTSNTAFAPAVLGLYNATE